MKSAKLEKCATVIILTVLIFNLISIVIISFIRLFLVKKLGIENKITNVILAEFDEPNNSSIYATNNKKSSSDNNSYVAIDWKKLYPFESADPDVVVDVRRGIDKGVSYISKITDKIDDFKSKVDKNSKNIFFKKTILDATSKYKELIKWNILPEDLFLLDDENITAFEPRRETNDIEIMADNIESFREYANSYNIPIIYINDGRKVKPGKHFAGEYSNENSKDLLNALKERHIDTLDMPQEMIEDGLDWYSSYYKTDHHWSTKTGLWAAKTIAEKLNKDYGFHFDLSNFDENQYNINHFDGYWIGQYGRKLRSIKVMDDYDKIIPKETSLFTVIIPTKNYKETGSFDEVLFKENVFDNIADYQKDDYFDHPDAYECSGIDNYALEQINNLSVTNNTDKKILFIQDSFSWYSTAFLACDIKNIDIIYPKEFTGSIQKYIESSKPDVIIISYSSSQICQDDLENITEHTSMFDFR